MGRRRASHLNPGHVVVDGVRVCKLALDSRFISGNAINPVAAPTDLSGCQLWLNADSISGDTDDPSGTWSDGSGQSNDATQSTADYKPTLQKDVLNGHAVVRFDGTDDRMSTPSITLNDFTYFVVIKQMAATSVYANVIGQPSGNYNQIFVTEAGGEKAYVGAESVFASSISADFHAISLTAGASVAGYVNGSIGESFSGSGSATTGVLQIGHFNNERFWNGDIAEVIIYDRALSPIERKRVEAYLNHKYALWSAPALTDPITTWGDRSDNGNDATGSGTARPTLQLDASGRRVVRFDGSDDFLAAASLFSGATPRTVIAAYKVASATGRCFSIIGQSGTESASAWFFLQVRQDAITGDPYLAGFANDLSGPAPDGLPKIACCSYDGSLAVSRKNGVVVNSGSKTYNTNSAGLLIGKSGYSGGGEFTDGDFFAVLVFTAVLPDVTQRRIENAFARAFKLQTSTV